MGLKIETGKQSRKFNVVLIRTCCRSICNHPFLVGTVFSLIFLYRSFPFLFSLLVYASPILVCTAILLGTLLSLGQSNTHETKEQEFHSHGVASHNSRVSESDIIVVKRDESLCKGQKNDAVVNKVCKAEDDHVPNKEAEGKSNGSLREGKPRTEGVVNDEEAAADPNSLVQENGSEILGVEIENSPRGSAKEHKEEPVDTCAVINGSRDENENDDYESENMSLNSESDRADSSSLDGSVADMVPMLDEIHPLLFKEAPQPHQIPGGNGESDEDAEIHGEVEDDGVDDDEEEEGGGVKEDDSKSAIKWTEDDQKNLMDLGTLELERNQCLENLIARRRAFQRSKTMAEKNLIDLDFPSNVTPLSVKRRNPFDFPYDSTNLGSAPSKLLPRRNPFELPFESKEARNEEKSDDKADGFEQQPTTYQKDIFFRRHESFSLGPSTLGFVKQEKQDMKWRPVFIPERFVSEGTSYSSISRQSSGVSDSKLSSTPDSDSASSVEQDFSKEKEIISNLYQTSNLDEHQSPEDEESEEMVQIEKRDVEDLGLEITLGQVENHSETEFENHSEAEADNHSETDAEKQSESEVENHSESDAEKQSETEVENHSETESSMSKTEEEGDNDVEVELKTSETHFETEPVEEENSTRSSLSSMSDADPKNHSDVQNGDGSLSVEIDNGEHINGVVDENIPEEPVYDASPTAAGKLLSLSIASDTQAEILEIVKHPESEAKMDVVVEEEKTIVHNNEEVENSHPEKD